ncbi:MAG TPA: site-2 protease family protein [Candidatus Paceibacterota bacterium]|nr:site-2 protease family protein [Candidatus Paceibacterota bacterium]
MAAQLALLISLLILIFSIILHEIAHGAMANWLGDPTARLQGRLTLNPIPHIDPFGSVILPALLVFSHSGFLFGWAKPVPYNPYNLRRGGRFAEGLVALAGPATNLLLALIAAATVRVLAAFGAAPDTLSLAFYALVINVMLAIFNCIPIPPLDGSKILDIFLPAPLRLSYDRFRAMLERNPFAGLALVILFAVIFGDAISSVIFAVANLLAGS